MPLSETEKIGVINILEFVKDPDLKNLALTVSNNILNPQERNEAIETIVNYTNHPFELFKRKKLKKETLFLYADKFKINGCLPKDTKKDLISKILVFWNSNYDVEEMEDEDIPPESSLSQSQLTFPQNEITHFKQPQNFSNNSNQNSAHHFLQNDQSCWFNNDLLPSEEDKEFSMEFCKWYYVMLNNLHINPDHTSLINNFFIDCSLHLLTENHNEKNIERMQGAEIICQRLMLLTSNVTYNPNLNERGLKTFCDRFGRRVIVVAGTIHSGNEVGLFEQQFGLLRDSTAEYNWKIKSLRLALSNQPPSNQISLEHTKQLFSCQSN